MAILKDLIVNGATRLIGDTFANKVTISTLADSAGNIGTDGQVLKSDGENIVWSTDNKANITTTANSVAYYSDTTGTFASDADFLWDATNNKLTAEKLNGYVIAGQKSGTTLGTKATAEGNDTTASGVNAHAEGDTTTASSASSHAEGYQTIASGNSASKGNHAEGSNTTASGQTGAHAEGVNSTASGSFGAHAEGYLTTASGTYGPHAEGYKTTASGLGSHAENQSTTASGAYSHVEGGYNTASGTYAHAEGYATTAQRRSQHVFGEANILDTEGASGSKKGTYIEIVGNGTASDSGGVLTVTTRSNARTLDWNGNESLAGNLLPMVTNSKTLGDSTHTWADAYITTIHGALDGNADTATGANITTTANSVAYYSDTTGTFASDADFLWDATNNKLTAAKLNGYVMAGQKVGSTLGTKATAEGFDTVASGYYSHAEGYYTSALGDFSHAEGNYTVASGDGAHAEGYGDNLVTWMPVSASGVGSHAEGYVTTASGDWSHAEGYLTTAQRKSQHTFGEYNILDTTGSSKSVRGSYIEIVGNGTSSSARSNARTLDWNGNEQLAGNLLPMVPNSKTLGSSSLKWNNVYATTFTGNLTGNADTATKLVTARNLTTKLDSTTAVTFDGSANQNAIPVTGTLPVANGGTAVTTVDDIFATYGVEYIVGTQTAKTGSWTGVTNSAALYVGKTIAYKLPFAGSGQATLNLTLADGTTTGAKAVYAGNTRLTTHYPANSIMIMTWNGTDWRTNPYYDTNTNTLLRVYSSATNINVPLIGQSSANSTTATWATYTNTYKDWYGAIPNDDTKRAKINLSTGILSVPGGVNGYVMAGQKAGTTLGIQSTAEGNNTTSSGGYSHAEGSSTTASGMYSHAEGSGATASGNASHAESSGTTASGMYSHAEGGSTTASGNYSHAEGGSTTASSSYAHAEGAQTKAQQSYAHAEGYQTIASGAGAHAEGYISTASALGSHTEGGYTTASGDYSHAEGYNAIASGKYSHAEGQLTTAQRRSQHVFGEFNILDTTGSINTRGDYVEIVGNGTDAASRSNARTLDWNGNESLTGGLTTPKLIGSGETLYGEILPETGTEGQIFFQLSDGYTYELPAGGAVDEMLIKNSATDRDVKWTRDYIKRTGDTMTGPLTMLSRATTTAPSAATDRDWITLTPYFHTGGPWIIRNTDDSSASYLKIIYGNNTTFNMKHDGTLQLVKAYGAVWNDYAEFRETKEDIEPGRCIRELGDDTLELTTERLMRGCEIVSDTFGFAIGQSEKAKTPTAASGRVLAYLYEDRELAKEKIGWPVCSGPNGTVSIMIEEEEEKYPSRIIGTISAVPDYEIWYGGNNGDTPIQVNGRIWIRIR